MAVYQYTARNEAGEVCRSTITAASRYEALATLFNQGLTVISLEGDDDTLLPGGPVAAPGGRAARPLLARITLTDRATFCRQLAVAVGAGIPLREALESIAVDSENAALGTVLVRVVRRLHEGLAFSQAISPEERVFSRLFVALIRSAEEAGTMAETLDYLAASLEKADRLARKIRSITAYPAFVFVIFCLTMLVMTLLVLPRFRDAFDTFEARLPLLTRVVLGVNAFIIDNILWIGLGLAAVVAAALMYGRTAAGRRRVDALKLRLPFFGVCIRKLAIGRFCRNLGVMVRGGVPVATAIAIASDTVDNVVMEHALAVARERILTGMGIAASLDRAVFPALVRRMINVGEPSGRLPEVLERVSDMYDDQVEGAIMVATSIFEPVAICVFGALVLLLVLAMYLPVFTIASTVK